MFMFLLKPHFRPCRFLLSLSLSHEAWSAYMERKGMTHRSVDNVREEFNKWLLKSEFKVGLWGGPRLPRL